MYVFINVGIVKVSESVILFVVCFSRLLRDLSIQKFQAIDLAQEIRASFFLKYALEKMKEICMQALI